MNETGAISQSDALPALKTAHPTLYPHPHIFHLPGQAPDVGPGRNPGKPCVSSVTPFSHSVQICGGKITFIVLIPKGSCAQVASRVT